MKRIITYKNPELEGKVITDPSDFQAANSVEELKTMDNDTIRTMAADAGNVWSFSAAFRQARSYSDYKAMKTRVEARNGRLVSTFSDGSDPVAA